MLSIIIYLVTVPLKLYFWILLHLVSSSSSSSQLPAICNSRDRVPSLGREDPLEKEMATHSSILAWRIPWTGEPGGLQSRGSQRVGHDWVANTQTHVVSSVAQSCLTLCNPMDCSMPGLPVHHQLPEVTQTCVHQVGDAIQPSHPLLSPSPPALNLFQCQGLFQWVSSSHQVAEVLELQHQSFQWIFRTDFL